MLVSETTGIALRKAVAGLRMSKGDALLALLAVDSPRELDATHRELCRLDVPFFGGVFPGLIAGAKSYGSGVLLIPVPCIETPFAIAPLSTLHLNLPAAVARISDSPHADSTALIFADGFSPGITGLLAEMFELFGNTVNYLGAGAGFADFKQRPCVFTREGIAQDAAVVAFTRLRSSLGVRHGWEPFYGPVVATRTHLNVVSELNWRNAFDVYSEIVGADSGRKLTPRNFSEIARSYPFGIMREKAEHIVRDPFSVTPSGELVCVGHVPENTVLHVLRGNKDALIAAAGQAAEDCIRGVAGTPSVGFVADCISRSIYLGPDIATELETVQANIQKALKNTVLEGILSIGEISSHGEGVVDLLNKSTVVGVLHNG